MKSVLVLTFCDQCDAEGVKRSEGVTGVQLAIDGRAPLTLDLCDEHYAYLDPVRELLKQYGQAPEQQPKPARAKLGRPVRVVADAIAVSDYRPAMGNVPVVCPLCQATPRILRAHLDNVHNINANTMRGEDGRYQCPLCASTFGQSSALGNHVVQRHDTLVSLVLAQRQAEVASAST